MPKNSKQIIGLLALGGLAALGGGIAADVSKQGGGTIGGFIATVVGGAAGAAVGLAVLGGSGVRFA